MASVVTTIYDDSSPSFTYQPGNGVWTAGTWNASSVDQSGTLHVTNSLVANVTFVFPVAASGFSYYGIQRSNGARYGICIDCTPGAPNFIPIDGLNKTDNGANPPVLLFQRNFTDVGVHQIIIQNMPDERSNPPGNSQITIDRIELFVPGAKPGTTTVFIPKTATLTSSSTTTSKTNTSTGSTRPTDTNNSSSSPPIGAIVGGVLGGLAVIIALIILFYWLRLRRRRSREADKQPVVSQYFPEPFSPAANIPPVPGSALTNPPGSLTSPWAGYSHAVASSTGGSKTLEASRNTHQRMMPSVTSVSTSIAPPSTTSASATSGSGSVAGPSAPVAGPRRERDAGPLPAPTEEEEELEEDDTLPPDYGEVFARRSTRRSNRITGQPVSVAPPMPLLSEKTTDSRSNGGGNGMP